MFLFFLYYFLLHYVACLQNVSMIMFRNEKCRKLDEINEKKQNKIRLMYMDVFVWEFYCIIIWGLMLQKEDAKKKNKSKGKTKYVCFFFS